MASVLALKIIGVNFSSLPQLVHPLLTTQFSLEYVPLSLNNTITWAALPWLHIVAPVGIRLEVASIHDMKIGATIEKMALNLSLEAISIIGYLLNDLSTIFSSQPDNISTDLTQQTTPSVQSLNVTVRLLQLVIQFNLQNSKNFVLSLDGMESALSMLGPTIGIAYKITNLSLCVKDELSSVVLVQQRPTGILISYSRLGNLYRSSE